MNSQRHREKNRITLYLPVRLRAPALCLHVTTLCLCVAILCFCVSALSLSFPGQAFCADYPEAEDHAKADNGVKTSDKAETDDHAKANNEVKTSDKAKSEDHAKADDGVKTSDKAKAEDHAEANNEVKTSDKAEAEDHAKADNGVKTSDKAKSEDHAKANNEVKTSDNAKAEDCAKAKEWYQKGMSFSDDSIEEMTCHQKAIELCPEYTQAHERLGNIYRDRQQWDLAVKELRLACETGNSSDPHTSLGEIYRMQGQYGLAIQEFQIALDIRANDKRAQANLEYIYRLSGRDDAGDEEHSLVPSPIFSREPGFTLPMGRTLVDLQFQSSQIRREWISPVERPVNIWKLIAGIRYGLTDNFMVGVIPKMLWKEADVKVWGSSGETESKPSAYGLGDTIILLKQCIWSRKQTSWSASLNINVPTGDENTNPPLGSGKYEFMPGMAFSTSLRDLGYLHANLSYFFTRRRDNGLDPGDEFSYNLALCRPVHLIGDPYFLSIPVTCLVGVVELNGVYIGKSRGYKMVRGFEVPEPQTGSHSQVKTTYAAGNTLCWSPGVQFIFYGNMKLQIGIQVPILVPDDPWINKPAYQIGVSRFF
jgi:hypothetical protein